MGAADSFSSGIRSPADPRGPLLCYFIISIFSCRILIFFSKAPKKTETRAKKMRFFGQIFPKSAQNAIFDLFIFQTFACAADNLVKIGSFSDL